jgi:hypothetical protein
MEITRSLLQHTPPTADEAAVSQLLIAYYLMNQDNMTGLFLQVREFVQD